MDTPLLATKLFIPPVASSVVARPRLLQRLRGVVNSRLTLVSAPAGFGKTTLLSQWIRESGIPTAWLSLEDGENDPVRFWEYFITSLRTVLQGVGETALDLLRPSQPSPIEQALTILINEITAVQRDFAIVMDDYHVVQSEAVHKGVAFLLDHLPAKMHVIIGTRADPPLPLPRFRGNGTLLEVGADDLRFTLAEAVDLLSQLGSPLLSADDIEALNARTEGWAVGLKMAVLSMRGSKAIGAFIASFTGSHRYVMDYLIEEVLQRQSAPVRTFLLQTSVLERMTGPLCDAVTGSAGGKEVLSALDKANLFIIALDTSSEWSRYHHLFRDLLRHRLRTERGDDEVRNLHMRASVWYEDNGFPEEAISHALSAHAWEKAMELIGRPEVASRAARSPTMLNWLQKIPEELLRAKVKLYLDYVWALEGAARYSEADDCLNQLDAVARSDSYVQSRIAILRTFIASDKGDFLETERYAQRALALLAEDDVGVGLVSGPLAGIYMSQGRFAEAEPLIRRNYESIRRAGNINNAVLSLIYLGFIAFLKGNLHEAVRIYHEAVGLAARNPNTATVCLAHLYLGAVYYEWNELGEAAAQQQQAIDTYRSSRIFGSMDLDTAYLHLARTRAALADFGGASQALDSADRIMSGELVSPVRKARNAAHHAAIASVMGDAEEMSRWIDVLLNTEGVVPVEAYLPALQLVLARKDRVVADEKLTGMYDFFAPQGLRTLMVGIRTHQALCSIDANAALQLFDEALAMGKPEGFTRIFADLGVSLMPLLRRAISRGAEKEYASKLLGILEEEERRRQGSRTSRVHIPHSSESLSQRELEILRLVAAGLSNRQITQKLNISLNTAKKHMYNVCQRLQVSSRTQAVARARELKLI